jgi:hypothetical protein
LSIKSTTSQGGGLFLPNKRNIVIVTILAILAIGSLVLGYAAFAQSSTTTTNSGNSTGTYSIGHNCPKMGSASTNIAGASSSNTG